MGERHFDEAYIGHKKYCMNVEELIRERSLDGVQFVHKYAKDLYCHECKKAHLELEFGKTIQCLRTLKGDVHLEGCQYSPDVKKASKKQIQEYMKNVNPQTIENNLLKLLFRLGVTQKESQLKTVITPAEFTFILYPSTIKKTTGRVYIPQHKIKNGEDKFEYGVKKYYYGEVMIKINRETEDVLLKIYPLQNATQNKPLFSVFVPQNIDLSMIDNSTNSKYYVAFFGEMKKRGNFTNLDINKAKHNIVLQRCE